MLGNPPSASFTNSNGVGWHLRQRTNSRRTLVCMLVDELVIVTKTPVSFNSWSFILG